MNLNNIGPARIHPEVDYDVDDNNFIRVHVELEDKVRGIVEDCNMDGMVSKDVEVMINLDVKKDRIVEDFEEM